MSDTIKVGFYVITNKDTGESIDVLPHTAGEGVVSFAPVAEAGTDVWVESPTLYEFQNPDNDGSNLSSEDYTIAKGEGEVEVPNVDVLAHEALKNHPSNVA